MNNLKTLPNRGNMLTILGVIVLGIPFGYYFRKKEKCQKIVEILSSYTLYTLLFFLGVQIGANESIISNIDKLGFEAFIYALTISVVCMCVGKFIHKFIKNF